MAYEQGELPSKDQIPHDVAQFSREIENLYKIIDVILKEDERLGDIISSKQELGLIDFYSI